MRARGRFWAAVFALLLVLSLSAGAAGDFYVQDGSGVLSSGTREFIMKHSPALAKQAEGAQIVVMTVPTTGDKDEQTFAIETARALGIGDEKRNNGVLILLVTEDRKVRVEVGYGLEGALPDGKTGRLIDSRALPHYRSDDFDTGTLELYKGVLSVVMQEYGIEELEDYRAEEENGIVETIVPFILLAVLLIFLFGRRGRGGGGFFFFGPHIHYPHHRGGGGFGGFGGGGFGGGGFGGGGGSFGGGGAGRSF